MSTDEPRPTPDVTALLSQATDGNQAAANELLPLVYQQLRAIAQNQMAGENPGHTLQATAPPPSYACGSPSQETPMGEYSGKMINLDQDDAEVPLSTMQAEDGEVTMQFDTIDATFRGKFNEQTKETVGTWQQGEQQYDFIIKRVG